jgi:hypothetical protein
MLVYLLLNAYEKGLILGIDKICLEVFTIQPLRLGIWVMGFPLGRLKKMPLVQIF